MERDPRGFLYDAKQSAESISRFLAGISEDDYLKNELLRAAVEKTLRDHRGGARTACEEQPRACR